MTKHKMAIFLIMALSLLACTARSVAQTGGSRKMSHMIGAMACRHAAEGKTVRQAQAAAGGRSVCALVRIQGDGGRVLEANGCRQLARLGDIYVADIPVERLRGLAAMDCVSRIEAGESRAALLDTTAIVTYTHAAHTGAKLQHPFRGEGVVMGLMDVGFDFTHPSFYDSSFAHTRIKRVWDQVADRPDGSALYVGDELCSEDEILRRAHSRDAIAIGHGTHTLGIAAGNGYDTPYCGIAPAADICLVNNAVADDIPFIAPDDLDKYTTATDVLGFKYIFDYAEAVGKPCVISFSEGSPQTFDNDEELYYEALARLTGPGRVIVASAGNMGHVKTYFHKPEGQPSGGSFFGRSAKSGAFCMTSAADFTIRIAIHDWRGGKSAVDISTADVRLSADSTLTLTLCLGELQDTVSVAASAVYFDPSLTVYSATLKSPINIGSERPLSVEIIGDAAVDVYGQGVYFNSCDIDPALNQGEMRYSLHSPSSAPSVISVGATSYRDYCVNADGEWIAMDWGRDGVRAGYSSVGPTADGRVKPDVVAPGSSVVSAFSSYFAEAQPDDADLRYITRYSNFNSRRYPWMAMVGTSMSAPVVGGAIALWLEANPQLTASDILDVFAATCHRRDGRPQGYKDEYYGYGEIDVYAGLLKVLGVDGIDGLSHHTPAGAVVSYTHGEILLTVGDTSAAPSSSTLYIYTLGGVLVHRQELRLSPGTTRIAAGPLPKGVYAVQLSSSSPRLTGSAVIRVD